MDKDFFEDNENLTRDALCLTRIRKFVARIERERPSHRKELFESDAVSIRALFASKP